MGIIIDWLTNMEERIKKIATAFKGLAKITCWILFVISLVVLLKRTYHDLKTGITLELITEKSLFLPTITFCLEEPFKSAGKVTLIKSCGGLILWNRIWDLDWLEFMNFLYFLYLNILSWVAFSLHIGGTSQLYF